MKRLFYAAAIVAMILVLGSGAAFAQDTATTTANMNLTLTGALTINFVAGDVNFTAVTLDGSDQTSNATSPVCNFTVLGYNGAWDVTYSSAGLVHSSSSPTLPVAMDGSGAGALSGHISGTNPTVDSTADNALLTGYTVINANGAKGVYTYTPTADDLTVSITGATAKAGSYTGTLTATLTANP